MSNFLKEFVDGDNRRVHKTSQLAKKVEAYAKKMSVLTDQQLQAKTNEFRDRYRNGESLDKLLPEAFAVVREAAKRVLGMYPFHVQIMGGVAIHNGDIAEMKTGEGKTLTATMPVYLNAIPGKGVHMVTVNPYLAERDATEMGELYKWLGLTVGLNSREKGPDDKRVAYSCDITFSTNDEIGFDYLRDNMVYQQRDKVQRGLNFALIDEADSILIDDAKTPLIIAGGPEENATASELYKPADDFVKTLTEDIDYEIDEDSHTIVLTDEGTHKAEKFFKLDDFYDGKNSVAHYVINALKANYLIRRDKEYIVRGDETILVDVNTGRALPGRRMGDGLHEALDTKEGKEVGPDVQVTATITYQNLFRMYKKLAGMTGTAHQTKEELLSTFNMQTIMIPTNRPIQRIDKPTILYPTLESKFRAVIKRIQEVHATGQPLLVGTAEVYNSEHISDLLDEVGISHVVLNAKNDAEEAEIVRQAGQKDSVTIATNMAGRGTDIKLGPGVKEIGGLYVLGTERHGSARVDEQLRGRSGRQGDPGTSEFLASLEDDIVKTHSNFRIQNYLERLKPEKEFQPVKNKNLIQDFENIQLQMEGDDYQGRKSVLKFDDVMRQQRDLIYQQRDQVMNASPEERKNIVVGMINYAVEKQVNKLGIFDGMQSILGENVEIHDADLQTKTERQNFMDKKYREKVKDTDVNQMSEKEKNIILQTVDKLWIKHIKKLGELRDFVNLRGYGQKDPFFEYQEGGFEMFNNMTAQIQIDVAKRFFN